MTLPALSPRVKEMITFIGVGVLNTGVDFLVLNLLMLIFGVAVGGYYVLYKAISFLIANVNSYVLHATYTFRAEKKSVKSFSIFFVVTACSMFGNALVAWLVFSALNTTFGTIAAGNMGALIGTILSMCVNYIAYKYVVFQK